MFLLPLLAALSACAASPQPLRAPAVRTLTMQEEDGSVGAGLCHKFARGGLDLCRRGLTAALTVLAVRA